MPDVDRHADLRDYYYRVIPDGGGSGIQFDTDNQGGYLMVTSNDPSPETYGMVLRDTTDSGFAMHIQTTGAPASSRGSGLVIEAGEFGTGTGGTVDIYADQGTGSNSGVVNLYGGKEIGLYTSYTSPAGSGDIGLYAARDNGLYSDRDGAIYADRDAYLLAGVQGSLGGDVRITADSGSYADGTIYIAGPGEMNLAGAGGYIWMHDSPLAVEIGIEGTLEVRGFANVLLFRIDSDGSLHGKTGQSLVFDL